MNYKAIDYLLKFRITAKASDVVADISISEQQLLHIARSTVSEDSEIVILDEPTTSLTSKDINFKLYAGEILGFEND